MNLCRAVPTRFVCRSCTQRLGLRGQRAQQQRWLASSTGQSTASSTTTPDDMYDVVCVGGGPAGLSLLTALRANPVTAGLRLALVEAQDLGRLRSYAPSPDQFANRCSSLTPASARYLDRIGAWSHLHRERVQAYEAMQVWDGVTGARISFDWPFGADVPADTGSTVAFMVENNNLTAGLLRRLEELGGVSVWDKARVDHIGYGSDGREGGESGEGGEGTGAGTYDLSAWPAVHLASGKTLLARLLVGADGANSPVRTFADIEARGWDYDRHGVVATLELEDAPTAGAVTAFQRFLPTGPVAMLPLPGRFATLVWSTTPDRAAFLRSLAPPDFAALVNAAFRLRPADLAYLHGMAQGDVQDVHDVPGDDATVDIRDEVAWRLAQTPAADADQLLPPMVAGVQSGTVASFPLRMRHADTYIGERVALVGDAAHTVHPLAGQGLNQGQGDVESLARTIAYAVSHGQDLGVRTSLESYASDRYAANHVMLGVCDKLHKLFSVGSGPLVPLRSWGLRAVDALQPVKSFLMQQAAGGGEKRW